MNEISTRHGHNLILIFSLPFLSLFISKDSDKTLSQFEIAYILRCADLCRLIQVKQKPKRLGKISPQVKNLHTSQLEKLIYIVHFLYFRKTVGLAVRLFLAVVYFRMFGFRIFERVYFSNDCFLVSPYLAFRLKPF